MDTCSDPLRAAAQRRPLAADERFRSPMNHHGSLQFYCYRTIQYKTVIMRWIQYCGQKRCWQLKPVENKKREDKHDMYATEIVTLHMKQREDNLLSAHRIALPLSLRLKHLGFGVDLFIHSTVSPCERGEGHIRRKHCTLINGDFRLLPLL